MKQRLLIGLGILLLSGCSSLSGLFSSDDNTKRASPLPEYVDTLQVNLLWDTSVGGGFEDQVVKLVASVSDERVFAADRNGLVAAFNKTNGEGLWERETELAIAAGPGYGEALVVVGTSDAEVLALNEDDGSVVWQVEVSSEVLAVPQVADGVVVIRTVDGRLYGLDAENGQQKWFYDWKVPVLSLRGTSSPVISDDIVLIGFATGKLAALSLQEGDLLWESSVAIPKGRTDLDRMVDIDSDPVVDDGYIYVATFQGQLASLELETGVLLWKRDISAYTGMAIDWGQLYVTDYNSNVLAVDPSNGASVWKQIDLTARHLTAPVVQGEYIVVADFEGYLHWMSRANGAFVAKLEIDDEGISSTPVVQDGVLYSLTNDGQLAAISIGDNIPQAIVVEKPESSSWWKLW